MTSATAETQALGDPANAQGFKDGSGVLLASGDCIWTGYTTNDTTAPATSPPLTLNGRDFLTFRYILFVWGNLTGGNAGCCISAATTNSINIVIRDCAFLLAAGLTKSAINYIGLADVAANWTIDRCHFLAITDGGSVINVTLPTSASADYDANFLIQNCVIEGAFTNAISVAASGAASFKGGGVDVFNSRVMGGRGMTTAVNVATSIPCTFYNSVIMSGNNTGLSANASGQIVEDYNRIIAATPRTNVSVGGNSISDTSMAHLVEFGYAEIAGRQSRPTGTPMANSPLLGRGNQAGGPTVDILNRPRPAGGASTSYAWGAYERHDTAAKETSVVDAGSNAIKITGPGDHDFLIPVDATSTTITVRARYDTNHAATNKPQATILNGEEIGVATETKTMTAAVDTWETLTFSAISPTAKGFVTLRLISRSAAGNGIAYFDTVSY